MQKKRYAIFSFILMLLAGSVSCKQPEKEIKSEVTEAQEKKTQEASSVQTGKKNTKILDPKKYPNVLFIYPDQHRYDCIGAYGNPDVKTPNIDSLAADGVLYQNHFVTYAMCTPSRYSVLSGLYVHQHLGWNNNTTLAPGMDTFPRILRQQGYHTKAVGKMHFRPMYLDVGFDEMELSEKSKTEGRANDYYSYLANKGIKNLKTPKEYWGYGAEESAVSEEDHMTTWVGDRALETIQQWEGGGNLLMVGFNRPHRPFDPPAPWNEMYDPEKLTILPGWTEELAPIDVTKGKSEFDLENLTEEKLRKTMAYYYGCISQVDHHVGRMIDALKEKGLYEDTLIIYSSDHGEYIGYHHLVGKTYDAYDPIIKSPLIIKYPEQKNAGVVSDKLVSNIDVAPTILKQAGASPGKFMGGLDLSNINAGRNMAFSVKGRGTAYIARTSGGKLILDKNESQSRFFDLTKDPFEMNNLYKDPNYQVEIAKYKEALMNWMLFNAPSPSYEDDTAPVIPDPSILKVKNLGK